MQHIFVFIISFIFLTQQCIAQLSANAGSDTTICYNGTLTLGGSPSATGGKPPYSYLWQPSTFLNSATVANPVATNLTHDITYTLTITDYDTTIATNTIFINIDKIYTFDAGIDTGYCIGQMSGIQIGAFNNNNTFHNFSWTPTNGLDNPNSPRPMASPSTTTVYTLTVSDNLCPDNTSTVIVHSFEPPYVYAGQDTTIDEGQTITLKSIGAKTFWWQPDYNIKYIATSQPDVWPISTTVYHLYTVDQHGCHNSDSITVNVRNGDILFFYSAFTPNSDGDNDVFYIGNIEKYPDNNLKIYNRYGKMIYSATNYNNSWDGTYLGNILPTGTYFYILNDGKDKKYKGSVTIIR